MNTAIDTDTLLDAVNADLLHGRLAQARAGLDELARRGDLVDMLCPPSSYALPAGDYGRLIADRIELVNSIVEDRLAD